MVYSLRSCIFSLLFFSALLSTSLPAQNQYLVQVDSTNNGTFRTIIRDSLGNFICFQNPMTSNTARQLMKIDSTGLPLWIKNYTGALGFNDIIHTSDGNIIVTGQETVASNNVTFLWKLDQSGNTIWKRQLTEGGSTAGYSLAPTYDGGCMLAGTSSISKFFVIRFDASGAIAMQKHFTIASAVGGVCRGMVRTQDSCYVGGISVGYGANDGDMAFYKMDTAGNMLWTRIYDTQHETDPYRVLALSDGGFLIGAQSTATNNSALFSVALFRTDSAGHLLWATCYPQGPLATFAPFDVREMADHGFTFFSADGTGSYMVRLDSAGGLSWAKALNNAFFIGSGSVQSGDAFYIPGYYYYQATGFKRPGIMRLRDDSLRFCSQTAPSWSAIPISYTETSPVYPQSASSFNGSFAAPTFTTPLTIPARTILCSNLTTGIPANANENAVQLFPDPASDFITIRYTHSSGNSSIVITDVNGAVVQRVEHISGNETVVNVTQWASGVYFFRTVSESGAGQTGKFVVMHE